MRISIIAILVSISAVCFGQAAIEDKPIAKVPDNMAVEMDTITPTEISQKSLSELIGQLKEIGPKYDEAKAITTRYEDLVSRIMLIVTAYVDPDHFAGLTPDNKILRK